MKVGHSGSNSIQNSEANSAKRGDRAVDAQGAKRADRSEKSERSEKTDLPSKVVTSQGATAEISTKSREFSQAKAVATQTPDIREDRVSDLKKRIADGTYHVDEGAIADRMVDDHLKGPGIL